MVDFDCGWPMCTTTTTTTLLKPHNFISINKPAHIFHFLKNKSAAVAYPMMIDLHHPKENIINPIKFNTGIYALTSF